MIFMESLIVSTIVVHDTCVSLALVLAILALVIVGLAQSKVTKRVEETSSRGYRILIHVVFVILMQFFLLGLESFGSNV